MKMHEPLTKPMTAMTIFKDPMPKVETIAPALTQLLADVFALYFKTKNFHWHVSGPHFRDYHLMFDEQAGQIFAMTDAIAERVLKLGGRTLRSVSQIARIKRIADNEAEIVQPMAMILELLADNRKLEIYLRETHALCDANGDIATASLIEGWLDEAEQRAWFLAEIAQPDPAPQID